jgi:methanogenic corrinoid protein MtbC1
MQDLEHFFWRDENSRRRHSPRGDGEPSPPVVATGADAASWRASLERVIEAEIIPRLMLAQRVGHDDAQTDLAPLGDAPDEIAAFVEILLKADLDRALAAVRAIRWRGTSIEGIFMNLLAPSAKRLGELWESDQCDFVDVSIGSRRLQQIIQILSPELEVYGSSPGGAHRILLLATPGETHSLGLSIVEHFFRAAGWDVERSTDGAWRSILGASSFDLVGFSISCVRHIEDLKRAIATARNISRNPSIQILVGGRICLDHPEVIELIGADATAGDAASATRLARSLLSRQSAV